MLASEFSLTNFNPDLIIIIAPDANDCYWIFYFHKCNDGKIHAVSHESTTLKNCWKNCSNCKSSTRYLSYNEKYHKIIQRKFILQIDYHHLLTIFG